MSRSLRAGLAGLVGTLGIATALPALEPLDTAVHRALQSARLCSTEALAWDLGLLVAFMLGAAALAALAARPRRESITVTVGVIASGAVVVEGAKTLFERLRPDQMPYEIVGNSFPSGHVTNTTIAAAALWCLCATTGSPWARRVATATGMLAILAQGVSRLLLGAHWATDVLASLTLGIAWVGLVVSFAARPRGKRVVVGGFAAAVVLIAMARISLPSPHRAGAPTAVVDFERLVDRRSTRGPWIHGHREPIGAVAWLEKPEGSVALPAVPEPPREIRLAVRPTVRGPEGVRGCVAVVLSLGDWRSPPITLFRGWREIRIAPPPSAWRGEPPVLGVRILTDAATAASRGDFGWVAVRWIRLY